MWTPAQYRIAARVEPRTLLKAEILARVVAGEMIGTVCAQAGGPHIATVSRWAHADPVFGEALRIAKVTGAYVRRRRFDPVRARALLVRFAEGEALRDLVREPGMPNAATVRHWRIVNPDFGADMHHVAAAGRARRGGRLRVRPAARDWPWTEEAGDRALFHVGRGASVKRLRAIDPTLPDYALIRRWAREHPEFAHDLAVNRRFGHAARVHARMTAATETLEDGLAMGGTIRSLAGKGGLPSERTLRHWMARFPAFAQAAYEACDIRDELRRDRMGDEMDRLLDLPLPEARRGIARLQRRVLTVKVRPGKPRVR